MRLLLDENLSPTLSAFLIEAGHDVVHVRDRGLTSATDDVVLALAAAEGRVLISADTDFDTLLARSGAIEPSVVLIRRAVGRRAAQQARRRYGSGCCRSKRSTTRSSSTQGIDFRLATYRAWVTPIADAMDWEPESALLAKWASPMIESLSGSRVTLSRRSRSYERLPPHTNVR